MKLLCGTLQKEKCNLLVNESFDFKNVLGLNSHIKRPMFSIYKFFNLLVRWWICSPRTRPSSPSHNGFKYQRLGHMIL